MRGKLLIGPFLLAMSGPAILLAAIFAERLGFDPYAGWGRTRVASLILGIFLTVYAGAAWRYPDALRKVLRTIQSFLDNLPGAKWMQSHLRSAELSRVIRSYWFGLPLSVYMITVYVWFASSGTWGTWISPTRYFADLARGFQGGHLYLAVKINPGLLTSPDPYNPYLGWGIQGLHDVSYFQGRYYLPWGPTPALFVLLFRWIFHWWLGDLQLTFIFLSGLYLTLCLLVIAIWDRYFRTMHKWMLWMSILLIGLAGPPTFMLNSHNATRVYEAATFASQFFLLSGLLVAFTAMEKQSFGLGLALAGALWAFAIGTRLDLALPIGLMVLTLSGWFLTTKQRSLQTIMQLMPLYCILALGCTCLGWYNWARFGSVLETGYYYQLAGIELHKHWNDRFSLGYILPNLFYYLLNPVQVGSSFPFLTAVSGPQSTANPATNPYYFAQQITGLLWNAPFSVFALVPPGIFLFRLFKRKAAAPVASPEKPHSLNWVTLLLGGSSAVTFAFLLVYFWSAMRFLEQFLPTLLLLSIIGFWQGYELISQKSTERSLYNALGIFLAAFSIIFSILVAISANDARFGLIQFLSLSK